MEDYERMEREKFIEELLADKERVYEALRNSNLLKKERRRGRPRKDAAAALLGKMIE